MTRHHREQFLQKVLPGEDWNAKVEDEKEITWINGPKWTPSACTRKIDATLFSPRDERRTPRTGKHAHCAEDVQRAKVERINQDQARIKHRTHHRLNHPNEQAVAEAGSSAQMQRFARKYAVENALNRKEGTHRT